MQFNEGNYKKNYFWSKKIKTWEYLSNRKGLQRDLGVLIILRSRLKVWEPDSRFSFWLTESILSSCNSSGPLYLPDFTSWKQCWGGKKLYWASSYYNVLGFFPLCKCNFHHQEHKMTGRCRSWREQEHTKARPKLWHQWQIQSELPNSISLFVLGFCHDMLWLCHFNLLPTLIFLTHQNKTARFLDDTDEGKSSSTEDLFTNGQTTLSS